MSHLSAMVTRRPRLIVAMWLAVLIMGGFAAPRAVERLTFEDALPGFPAYEASVEVAERFGSGGAAPPFVLIAEGDQSAQVVASTAAQLQGRLEGASYVLPESQVGADASDGRLAARDGTWAAALVFPRIESGYDPYAQARTIVEQQAEQAEQDGTTVTVLEYGLLAEGSTEDGDDRGLLIEVGIGAVGALVVLIWVFASVVAVAPLIVASCSILATFLALLGLTYIADVSFIVQYLVALIGLGVAIDFSLLIATRWREELAAGAGNHEAVARSMQTAGRAVLVSGTTVAISLATLLAIPVPFLRSVGMGGLLIPVFSVAAALTLLPALLVIGGPRWLWPRRRPAPTVSRFWSRVARAVLRRRALSAVVAAAALVALALPALGLRLGAPPVTSVAPDTTATQLSRLNADGLPLGAFRPIEVLVDPSRAQATAADLAGIEGVGVVAPVDDDGHVARLVVLTRADPASAGAALDSVRSLPGTRVTGEPALDSDFVTATYVDGLWGLALLTLATFLLLGRALRSVWLPIKALLLNAISIAAAFGATVWIWQSGHGTEALFGTESTGVVATWVPIVAFAFLFGLSMDYEVFILSRMREAYDEHADTDRAVVDGIAHTGRLVTSAAAILVFAFVALATVPTVEVKILATTLALGIAIDAAVVRGVLAPALVGLFGQRNWWAPRWLGGAGRKTRVP